MVYALVTDHLGSVRMVVNVDTGVVAQRISYDAWGNASYDVGTWDVQPFGFAGGLYDPLTKLVHFGAREYDAVTGRWTRADPILFAGGDANLYAYVGDDPVNAIDPSGLYIPGSERLVEERRQRAAMWSDLVSTVFSGAGADWLAGNHWTAVGGVLSGAALGVLGAFDILMSDPSVQMACIGSPIAVNGGPGFLTGYTRHGLNQAVSREGVGVSAEAILDALQNPLSVVSQSGGRYLFSGENASVILNSNGQVITTWASGAGGIRVP